MSAHELPAAAMLVTVVHAPAEHEMAHGSPATHLPSSPHVRGILPSQSTAFGTHSPQLPAPSHTPAPHVVPPTLGVVSQPAAPQMAS